MSDISLEDLPQELLLHVCYFLSADDIRRLSLVSRKLKDTTYFDGIWKKLCYTDYNIDLDNHERNFSGRNLYLKILHPYGFIIGLWQSSVKYYGGLVEIKYEQDQLVAYELYTPYFLGWRHPLKHKKLFTISFDSDGESVLIMNNSEKEAKIRHLGKNDWDAFNFCLLKSQKPFQNLRGQEEEFGKWLKEQGYGPLAPGYDPEINNPADLLSRFLITANYWNSCTFRRIKSLPKNKPIYPIQPGLFKSEYGDHGLELILLTYGDDEPKATALKITGDPNVPAGKVTFFANLNHPLSNVTWEEQENCQTLSLVKAENIPYSHEEHLNTPPQVFRVPEGIEDEFDEPLPEISIGRFQGLCQLANHGYKNPCFTKGHWVIFDHDTFAFLFLEINSMSMYYRVTEPSILKTI